MSNQYIASSNVNVFPSALRTANSSASKYTSEQNLTGLVRSSVSKKSFVDSVENSSTAGNINIDLVIHGYAFSCKEVTKQNNLYAYIRVNNNGMLWDYEGGTDLDPNNIFRGIKFSDTAPDNTWTQVDGEYRKTDNNENYYAMQIYSGGNLVNTDRVSVSTLGTQTVGSVSTPIYLNNGVPTEATNHNLTSKSLVNDGGTAYTVGTGKTLYSGDSDFYTQTVRFDNGIPVAGPKLFVGSATPTASESLTLSDGDIWFKI